MSDDLDDLFSPEENAELAAWDADAYAISIEVPTSKITNEQLDDLFSRVATMVDEWVTEIGGRDWDPLIYGHGPLHRRAAQDQP